MRIPQLGDAINPEDPSTGGCWKGMGVDMAASKYMLSNVMPTRIMRFKHLAKTLNTPIKERSEICVTSGLKYLYRKLTPLVPS